MFPALQISNGTRVAGSDLDLQASSVEVISSGALDLAGRRVSLPAGPVTVKGELAVGAGGELQLGSAVSLGVTSSGTLRVVGEPGDPATVSGHLGGGYALSVDGDLAARNYAFRDMGPAGVVFTGDLAPAPDDLRGGVFDRAAPGGVLLDLGQGAGHVFWYASFLDSTGTAAANVRRSSGSPVAFANWGGAFGGEAFEDDPAGLIDWLPPDVTELASFSATNGPEQVLVEWETTREVDVDAFVLEAGPGAAGPFATLAELPPAGPGPYAFSHGPLPEDVAVHYRLLERVSSGALNLLAEDSATPYDADLPAVFRRVGPNGEFATLQAAVDAAAAPFAVLQVEAGTYGSFAVDAPAGNVHVVPDGSGPVVIDTGPGPLEVRNTLPGQTVSLVELVVLGSPSAPSIRIQDTQGLVILDGLEVHGGQGQPGIVAATAAAVTLQRSQVDGEPGLESSASTVYASRGALDEADLTAGSTLKTAQLAPAVTTDPSSQHVAFAGLMPDLDAPPFPVLGQPLTLDVETDPGAAWLVFASPGYGLLDLQDPALWQMAVFLDLAAFAELAAGAGDPVTGQATAVVQLPPEGSLLGREIVLQLLQVSPGAPLLRPSNVTTLFALP